MRHSGFLSIVSIFLCVIYASAAHGARDDDDYNTSPNVFPRETKHIEAYKNYAGESDITETIEFVSHDPAMTFQILDGSYKKLPEVIVKGALLLPRRPEPVPVVMLSPDSGGPVNFYSEFTKPFWQRVISRLLNNGIGIFILDGFGTRGIDKTYDDQSRYFPAAQFLDTLLAFKALSSDPRIDGKRIGVSGHSRGAMTSFAVVDRRLTDAVLGHDQYFAAALPMAAECLSFLFLDPKPTPTKILVLHGLADNYTPAPPCIKHVERMKAAGADINLILKDGWHHSFYFNEPPRRCAQCVYFYKCPFNFLLTDDGHMNVKFQEFLNTVNLDYEKMVASENRGVEFLRTYYKIYPKCGSMGVNTGGGHWRESAKIFSGFFIDTFLP